MIEMIDMGQKDDKFTAPQPSSGKKTQIRYPSIYLSDKVPTTLMDKEIGSMCRVEIIGKIVNKGIDEGPDKKRENMTIDIHKMGYIGPAGKKTKDEYNKLDKEGKEKYDKDSVGA